MKSVSRVKKFRVWFFAALLGLALLYGACSGREPGEVEKVLAAVKKNIDAANREDLEEYLDTLDEDSPYYKTTEAVAPRRFDKYDLEIELVDARVVNLEGGRAAVSYVQNVRKREGPEFQDVRVEGEFILRRDKRGRWKIEDTTRQKSEPLPPPEKPAGEKPEKP